MSQEFGEKKILLLNKIERTISDLIRGLPIIFNGYIIYAGELFNENDSFDLFALDSGPEEIYLIITAERAKFLDYKIQGNFAKFKYSYECEADTQPYELSREESDLCDNIFKIIKYAQLLPTIIIKKLNNIELIAEYELFEITQDEIDYYFTQKKLQIHLASHAKIVLHHAAHAEIFTFRDLPFFGRTNVAIIIGEQNQNKIPIVRIHSGCYTGDLLDSLQCDCGGQLKYSIQYMNKQFEKHNEYGILIYQAHDEGRNIGLVNKIHSYEMQNNGLNTIDANHALGYQEDERNFYSAINILNYFKVTQCHLMTNNPQKESILKDSKIEIIERIPIIMKANKHNEQYLQTKARSMKHFLD